MRTIRNCNVCVVGGAGFLGSHLVEHLLADRGCSVLVLDNLVAGKLEFIPKWAHFRYADITGSEDYLCKIFVDEKVEYVFNYAAYPYVPDSYARPLHVFDVNAMGAMKVINAAQEAGVKAILQVSSAEVFGGHPELTVSQKLNEEDPIIPHSSYGASKAAIDAWVQVRWKEAKTPCIALRQFNCVGERETHAYVVPEIISQLSSRSIPADFKEYNRVRLGNNSSRDFLYAGDAVKAAVELLEKGKFGEVYNSGSEQSVKVYDLAQMVADVMGLGKVEVVLDPARVRAWEIWHLASCNDKINATIEYRPQVSLEEALRRTVKWYQDNGSKWGWE